VRIRNLLRWLTALAVAGAVVVGAAAPASAITSSGHHDNFFYSCDASVYISDTLIGSPGKIEAWGGFSCAGHYWGGRMTLQIFKNGQQVKEVIKDVAKGAARTDHIDGWVANSSGSQRWSAKLWLFRPMSGTTLIATGEITS
jgi:hypothetical protein